MTRTIAIFATIIWTLAHTSHAQSRACRIVYPERPQEMRKSAYLFDGSKSSEVSLPSMNLSEVMHLADGKITISLTLDKIESPELLPAKAPQLVIPEHVRDFYIIMTADPANEYMPVKMILVDPEEHKAGPGETLWYNFTAHRIFAKLGGTDMSIVPGGQRVSKAPTAAGGYYEADFEYQIRGEGPLARITEQNWWHDSTSRNLGLIMDSGGRLPKIMVFRDFRTTEKESADTEADGGEVAPVE